MSLKKIFLSAISSLVLFAGSAHLAAAAAPPAQNPQNGSIGVEGKLKGPPPKTAPTIVIPKNGQSFTSVPIQVSGLCTSKLLVEVFKNQVFAGSAVCVNGSYSMQIDLFTGLNKLVARQYDALNQASPDSNVVSVTFSDIHTKVGSRILLTTPYSKQGVNPGDNLTWPLTLSGGKGPYAFSVDWGDKSTPDLFSRTTTGNFNINHVYKQPGTFTVTIRATDANGAAAFLQVVAVANGPTQQPVAGTTGTPTIVKTSVNITILLIMLIMTFFLLLSSFWLGRKHQLQIIRGRLRRGQRPF